MGNQKCRWYGGGNFLYAGDSPEMMEEGECMTTPPTVAPLPTEAPVAETVTAPPRETESPTAAQPLPCQGWCARHHKDWDKKCGWKNYKGCDPCLAEEPTPAP